ncbi:MAG: hypothetical protein SVG88_01635 [Halobacteriales archaeon]|nr:hypothetical protein [Halobacteriales archaeon]
MPSTPTPEDDPQLPDHAGPSPRPELSLVSERIIRTAGDDVVVFYPEDATEQEKLSLFIVANAAVTVDCASMR